MLRLFTGLFIPESISHRLALLQGGVPGARWVAPENHHITLNFIGEVDAETADIADEALSAVRARAFSLQLQGAGAFDKGAHMEALWLGVGKNDALLHLQEKTARALEAARVPVERRKYTPHLTLARLRHADGEMAGEFLRSNALFKSEPFDVTDFILFQSHLTKTGPHYEALRSYPLG